LRISLESRFKKERFAFSFLLLPEGAATVQNRARTFFFGAGISSSLPVDSRRDLWFNRDAFKYSPERLKRQRSSFDLHPKKQPAPGPLSL
jgi:hypothetical protein